MRYKLGWRDDWMYKNTDPTWKDLSWALRDKSKGTTLYMYKKRKIVGIIDISFPDVEHIASEGNWDQRIRTAVKRKLKELRIK
jgi:hypothetical protein